MGEEATKVVVPESVLKKQKRDGEWALAKKQGLEVAKKKSSENRKLIYKRAEQYSKEYENQEKELICMRREARLKGGFYVQPEAKLLFIIRIRGINAMDPKTRSIMQLLRLRQIFNGVFLKVNKATLNMLHRVEPYVTFGCPNLKSIREQIYKRGYEKLNKQRIPLTDNSIVEQNIMHLDIKPQNLLVSRTGSVKIADFSVTQAFEIDKAAQLKRNLWHMTMERLKAMMKTRMKMLMRFFLEKEMNQIVVWKKMIIRVISLVTLIFFFFDLVYQ